MINKIYDGFIKKLCQISNRMTGANVIGGIALIFLKLLTKTPSLKNIGDYVILNK